MPLSVIHRPVSPEALRAATLCGNVTLAEPRRKGRRHVRLYYDKDGRPFVRDSFYGRRYIKAIRFLCIDGKPLNCGAAVLAEPS